MLLIVDDTVVSKTPPTVKKNLNKSLIAHIMSLTHCPCFPCSRALIKTLDLSVVILSWIIKSHNNQVKVTDEETLWLIIFILKIYLFRYQKTNHNMQNRYILPTISENRPHDATPHHTTSRPASHYDTSPLLIIMRVHGTSFSTNLSTVIQLNQPRFMSNEFVCEERRWILSILCIMWRLSLTQL